MCECVFCECMCVRVCVSVMMECVFVFPSLRMCVSVNAYVCASVCVWTCVCAHVFVHLYVCARTCLCVHAVVTRTCAPRRLQESFSDPHWPILSVVYEFLLHLVSSDAIDVALKKRFIDSSFVRQLLLLFDSQVRAH